MRGVPLLLDGCFVGFFFKKKETIDAYILPWAKLIMKFLITIENPFQDQLCCCIAADMLYKI